MSADFFRIKIFVRKLSAHSRFNLPGFILGDL
jgi:hypothetical protein